MRLTSVDLFFRRSGNWKNIPLETNVSVFDNLDDDMYGLFDSSVKLILL